MDKFIKAMIAGFFISLLLTAMAPSKESAAAEEVFLFPQLTMSAAADRNGSEETEIVCAFKLSEILDSLRSSRTA